MNSFKHILIMLTILTVSIWFKPVTSDLTFEQHRDLCVGLIIKFTQYNNELTDYDVCFYGDQQDANVRFDNMEKIIEEKFAITENMIYFDTWIPQRTTLNVEVGANSATTEKKVNIIIALREFYTKHLKKMLKNNEVKLQNPVTSFCERKIQDVNSKYLKQIIEDLHE